LIKAAKYAIQKPSTCRATRATKSKLAAQSTPALYFSQQISLTRNTSVLLREKLITQGEKREIWTQNLQRNNAARQVRGFCISYFAALRGLVIAQQNNVGNNKTFDRLLSLNDVKKEKRKKS